MSRTSLTGLTRRRFIAVSAAAAGAAAVPRYGRAAGGMVEWRGVALGAVARIRLAHPDPVAGRALLRRCVEEIGRLESILSLYRPDSALCRLNAQGRIDSPPFELVELLSYATEVSAASGGAFDVTVQPLWRRLAAHFAAPGADPAGPALADLLPLVDWRNLWVDADAIVLRRAGMAVTLNGIAQGYITDKVAQLLRDAGMESVLLDLGEARAIGARPGGAPWRIALADPMDPLEIGGRLALSDAAVATSGGYGTPFDAAGQRNHLIEPRSGRSAPARRSVSVVAPTATIADAASTALALLPPAAAPGVLRRLGATAAYIQDSEGRRTIRV